MAKERLEAWKVLFRRALEIIGAAAASGTRYDDWSFGGGTVLMRRFGHRVSKDVDIFVPDPQYLGYVSPRLNDKADALTRKFLETEMSVKLYFPEGEIDFIASDPVTKDPYAVERILGRDVRVDSTAEIIGKKVRYRGRMFTGRDLFDFALVATRDPAAIDLIRPILRAQRSAIRERIATGDKALRTAFEALDTLDFRPTYDECLRIVARTLDEAG
ncbi:MAG TPA: nucleotidyl transferase AbiEii/AbiGii toxin family protein [Usitatibacter sp.]|nr:nucleotidyl transferase AbiEii/AbiGii toxin family protein [Usitatibacter sp.]